MFDETEKISGEKLEKTRVFVARRRHRFHRQTKKLSELERIFSLIEKKNKRNEIFFNFKPTFIQSRRKFSSRKISVSTQTAEENLTTSIIEEDNLPDVEDPLVFIEQMYQRLFTEDGQPRNVIDFHCQDDQTLRRTKSSLPPEFFPVDDDDDDDDENFRNSFLDLNDEPQRGINYEHDQIENQRSFSQKKTLFERENLYRTSSVLDKRQIKSTDDTDHEDLDSLSLCSISQTLPNRYCLTSSLTDDEFNQNDSKLLLSSGYGSTSSLPTPVHSKAIKENPFSLFRTARNSIRHNFGQVLRFVFLSKNVLIIPLILFVLQQRTILLSR